MKICSEYKVSNDLTKWRNQGSFSTWQSRAWEAGKSGLSYIKEYSFARWIIEKSDGLTTAGLQKLSETVGDYAYLILTSQRSMRGPIVGHTARNLNAQKLFLNTFENVINRRVDMPEGIQRFQKTLLYAGSKVDYAMGEFIYMLPSDMNLCRYQFDWLPSPQANPQPLIFSIKIPTLRTAFQCETPAPGLKK